MSFRRSLVQSQKQAANGQEKMADYVLKPIEMYIYHHHMFPGRTGQVGLGYNFFQEREMITDNTKTHTNKGKTTLN